VPGRDQAALLRFRCALDWGVTWVSLFPTPWNGDVPLTHVSWWRRGHEPTTRASAGDLPLGALHGSLVAQLRGGGLLSMLLTPLPQVNAGNSWIKWGEIWGRDDGPKVRVQRLGGQATDRKLTRPPHRGQKGTGSGAKCLEPIGPGTLSKLKRFRCARNGPLQTVAKYFSCSGLGSSSRALLLTIPFAAQSRDR